MDPRQDYQPAFILHTRSFRETSLLVDFFTANYGRVRAVARGAQKSKRQKQLFQPFVPLHITWSGRSDLKTLGQIEATAMAVRLSGLRLYSGMYVNELLMRLLSEQDGHFPLFAEYLNCLQNLQSAASISEEEFCLRRFELSLLAELGYSLDFLHEAETGAMINSAERYQYQLEYGFSKNHVQCNNAQIPMQDFLGADILALAGDDWNQNDLRNLKALIRPVIDNLLGDKPLNSRKLYRQVQQMAGTEDQ